MKVKNFQVLRKVPSWVSTFSSPFVELPSGGPGSAGCCLPTGALCPDFGLSSSILVHFNFWVEKGEFENHWCREWHFMEQTGGLPPVCRYNLSGQGRGKTCTPQLHLVTLPSLVLRGQRHVHLTYGGVNWAEVRILLPGGGHLPPHLPNPGNSETALVQAAQKHCRLATPFPSSGMQLLPRVLSVLSP